MENGKKINLGTLFIQGACLNHLNLDAIIVLLILTSWNRTCGPNEPSISEHYEKEHVLCQSKTIEVILI